MKLPFINRNRYVVLKAYTFDQRIHDKTPISISSKINKDDACPVHRSPDAFKHTIDSCYGYVGSLKRSATMSAWCELKAVHNNSEVFYEKPNQNFTHYDMVNPNDYNLPANVALTKIHSPWCFECNDKDMHFVFARHILNNTPMIIPTGVISFNYMHGAFIFNAIPAGSDYKIRYKTPLMSLYPLTDLPFHVESHLDADEYRRLHQLALSYPYLKKSGIKERLEKNN